MARIDKTNEGEDEMQVYDLKDFPVFQYWDFNRKEFEPRALNKLSGRFNDSLEYTIKNIKKVQDLTPENVVEYVAKEVVDATKYSVFYNSSYEASGPNSCCGGDDSIQEQFVCWALDVPVEEYRKDSGLALSPELYKGKTLLEWTETSELLRLIKKRLGWK